MNALRQAVEEYLSLRRELGFKLHDEGYALRSFIGFCEQESAEYVTADLARRWAVSTNGQPAREAWRLRIVRHFTVHHRASDPRTEIPSKDLLPHRYHRKSPCIFSDQDVVRLIRAARELSPGTGLRPQTYTTLFGLLATSGIRVGEALALDDDHIDWQGGTLVVHRGKFYKSRVVPVHASTLSRLKQYQRQRDRFGPKPKTPAFFVSESGLRLPYRSVLGTFRRLCDQLGLQGHSPQRRPHVHDLRHRFAVKTLIRWYQEGIDVERRLPVLSTYLGHVSVSHTYWYLSAVPELLRLATERLEQEEERHES